MVVLGFQNAATIEAVAPKYPETSFAIIDVNWLDIPQRPPDQLRRARRGDYLVGDARGDASETDTIGLRSAAMDVPLIRHFACGVCP